MNEHPPTFSGLRGHTSPRNLWWLLLLLLTGLLAIDGRSFWIDECTTFLFISQATLAEWWHDLQATQFAEAEMPLYLFYLWMWDKLFGHSEWVMRVASLPWFIIGAAVFIHSQRRAGTNNWPVILVIISSAFVWYYLNEARLYAMQLGVTFLIVGALTMLVERRTSGKNGPGPWLAALTGGIVLLSAISIIGMIWTSAALVAAVVLFPPSTLRTWIWTYRKSFAFCLAILAVLAGYYLVTVLRGARATAVGTTTWQTIAFIGYEQLGFAGLGPGRHTLREDGVRALAPYWPVFCLYAFAVGTVLLAGLWSVWISPQRGRALWVAAGLAIPSLFLLATGVIKHFRVLGRHFTPMLVIVVYLLALGIYWFWRRGWGGRLIVVLFIGLSFASAFSIRWAPRHLKDDYRSAVEFSNQALDSGNSVWWNASVEGAMYYGLPLTEDPAEQRKALRLFSPVQADVPHVPPPDYIVASKPDIYDSHRAVTGYVNQHDYQPYTNFPAFIVWRHHP